MKLDSFDLLVMKSISFIVDEGRKKNIDFGDPFSGFVDIEYIASYMNADLEAVNESVGFLEQVGYLGRSSAFSLPSVKLTAAAQALLGGEVNVQSVGVPYRTEPLSDAQIERINKILTELKIVSETIRNNKEKHQIVGLVRAVEILISIPDPPRSGIMALVRDPAFAGIVQAAALVAAIAALVKF